MTPGGTGSLSGIFVKHVLPNSPAGQTGQIFTGDRILEISGVRLTSSDHTVAVQAIKAAPNPVRFVVQSLAASSAKGDGYSQRTPTVSRIELLFFPANGCPRPLHVLSVPA